jgi:hypothetical protein
MKFTISILLLGQTACARCAQLHCLDHIIVRTVGLDWQRLIPSRFESSHVQNMEGAALTNMTRILPLVLTALLAVATTGRGADRFSLALEGGPVWTGYNDIRIPGDTGTRISFADELKTDRSAYLRVRAEARLSQRNRLALLIAPLRLEAAGTVDRPVDFEGTSFPARTPLAGSYRFDSYRLTWSYDILKRGRFEVGLGLTAKIRDAAVGLSASSGSAEKTNIGVVPLVHFRLRADLSPRVAALLEADAAAAPQGRAEDVLLALDYSLGRAVSLRLGYRLLEGGADNDKVYTFTWLNYAVFGLVLRF